MREMQGDLWDRHSAGGWVVVTTNPVINSRNQVVMGRGVALQTKTKFPGFAEKFAQDVKSKGNHVFAYPDVRIMTFPVKDHWQEPAKLSLIERSCRELVELLDRQMPDVKEVFMPRPGCGNGRLSWADVKPVLQKILDDRFVVCDVLPP